jgi:hypothetical protein
VCEKLWNVLMVYSFRILMYAPEYQSDLKGITVVPPYPLIQYPRCAAARKKEIENYRNKLFISFKTRAKRERAVT